MALRAILPGLALLICPALAGCGAAKGKPAPPVIVNTVRPSEAAQKELINVAKKIEDPAAADQVEFYVKSFEDPSKGWTWSDLDEYILRGSYSIQTKLAYENYRKIKIVESKK